ncbi:MAG: HigA family addiction module antidote protein [Planctomycetes bacterium]|nr:HigA family addiction module antidote protein [Planctomycetota bacterium]
MARHPQNQYFPDSVSCPGETLQETLDALGLTQAELAGRMGRTTKHVNEIVKGKASITPETALELESVLGVPARFWTHREQNYRESLVRSRSDASLEGQVDWLRQFPVTEMSKRGWIPSSRGGAQLVRSVLRFFGVGSVESWNSLQIDAQVALRHTRAFKSDPGALQAWLRRGELEARRIRCGPFDRRRFLDTLRQARRLACQGPGVFNRELPELLAPSGVAVVLVPELPGMRANGAARWLTPRTGLIQLSLRHKTLDTLWFSFFHEAGHLLLHGKKSIHVDESADAGGDAEKEADQFAQDLLIPPQEYRRLLTLSPFTEAGLRRFARRLEIDVGILVGRLQHEGLLPWNRLRGLRTTVKWMDE